MNKIKLAVTGCLGRMGQQIIKSSKLDKKFKLVTLTENRKINRKISGIKPELNDENAFKKANIIIDFTIPKCTFQVLKIGIILNFLTTDIKKNLIFTITNILRVLITTKYKINLKLVLNLNKA